MQTKSKFIRAAKQVSLIASAFLLLAGAVKSEAADGTWTNDFDSIWSDTTNWLNNVVADGSGATASFNNLGSTVMVNLDTPKTIANLLFVNGTYTITNNGDDAGNVLTLAGPSQPIINAVAASVQTIRRAVTAGTQGFVLDGGGQLSLGKDDTDPANTITGGVVLSNGLLVVTGTLVDNDNAADTLALGTINSFTFINGTLNLRPFPNTSPEYGNVNGDLIVPDGATGTLILPVRWGGSQGDGGAAGTGLGGSLTGTGTLNVQTKYLRNNVVGNWSGFTGQLNVTANATGGGDEFRVAFPGGLPNAALDLGGTAAFTLRYYPGITGSSNWPIGILTGSNPNAFMAGSSSGAFTLTYDVGAKQTNATDSASFSGSIVNGTGPAGLLKRGAGTQIIIGNNAHTGGTTISNGVLQIGDGFTDSGGLGTGPTTNYAALVLARGGLLSVPGIITGPGSVTNIGSGGTTLLLGTNNYTGPTTVSVGKLKVGSNSRATGSYTVADAAGLGGLLQNGGATVTMSSSTFGVGCSYDFDLATFPNPSGTVVSNTGSISMNGDITVNVSGSGLSVGTITLLRYGSRSGAGNFVQGTLPPYITSGTITDDTVNKRVTLTISTVFDSTRVWVGDTIGNWDIGNTANLIWKVAGSGAPTNYNDGDAVRFDDTSTGTNVANILTGVSPASVIVNNTSKSYTFGGIGAIQGPTDLFKQGNNTLTVAELNTYSGATHIDAGTIQIGDGVNQGALGTGALTNNGSILANNPGAFTMANLIAGTGGITQIGAGTLTLSGNSVFSGGVTVQPGTTLALTTQGNAAGIGGGIRINTARLTLVGAAGINANVGNIVIITNAVINSGATVTINPAVVGTNVVVLVDKNATASLITFNGDISGVSGQFINTNGGTMRFNSGGGNVCIGSQTALFTLQAGTTLQNRNGGTINLGALEDGGGIGGPQNANNATVNFSIGALNTSTLFFGTIFDNNTNSNNRLAGTTKVGSGTLTLSNALCTYFGPTVVSNGVLLLKASTGLSNTTPITVVSPGVLDVSALDTGVLNLGQVGLIQTNRVQTLRGNGTIQGNVLLGQYGRLEPGVAVATVGTLTVNGNATLSAGSTNTMDITTTGGPASDRLVANNITYGGTLVLTNLGTIAGSNTFQLFSGALSGTFANVITQNVSGLTWDLSKLNVNGTVTLVGVSLTPTNITAAYNGGNITISWPLDHKGWRLQAQTNTVSVGITPNWFDVPGSTTVNTMNIPINATNGTVFFRLISP